MRTGLRGVCVLGLCVGWAFAADASQAQVVERVLPAPAKVSDVASDARIDDAGRLIIVAAREGGRRAVGRLLVRRLLPSGAADGSFGRRGVRIVRSVSGGTGFAVGPMVLWRRHILVAGAVAAGGGFESCWVARLHASARLDASFSGDGVATFGAAKSSLFPPVRALAVGRHGSVYVAGDCGDEGVVKLRPGGKPDRRFGVAGLAPSPFGDGSGVAAMHLDRHGRLLLVANNGTGFELARLLKDGSLDSGFGDGGFVSTIFPGRSGTATTMLMRADGRIIVSGWCYESVDEPQDVCLARYLPNGAPDSSFGNGGTVMTQFVATDQADRAGSDQQALSAALRSDGTIVVGGQIVGAVPGQTRYPRSFVAEYRPDGRLRRRFFDGGWIALHYRHSWSDMLAAVRVGSAGRPYTIGTGMFLGTPERIEYARLPSDG
jgi:uncharacterized delta-60 repeat protein